MRNKDFLSILDLDEGGIDGIIQMADKIKKGETPQALAGKTIALLFENVLLELISQPLFKSTAWYFS